MMGVDVAIQPVSRGNKALKLAAILLSVAALYAVPQFWESTYGLHIMVLIFINVIVGSAWNILGGYTGQYSVGHAAYFGVGAYAVMMLLQYRQIAPWWGVWVGAALALAVAIVIGSICFRLRGPYFVLASIAVAEIFRVSALNLKVTNGAEGILVTEIPPLVIAGRQITDWYSKVPFYYTGLTFALLIILVTYVVRQSKLGYFFQAVREDQDAAHSLGISLTYYKNFALGISAVFTALAGSLFAVYVGFIDPTTVLALDMSVQIVMVCIIGGIGTIFGPVVGALVLVPLAEALRSNMITDGLVKIGVVGEETPTGAFLRENLSHAHILIYGILVVVVMLFMPQGILGFVHRLATRKRRG